MVGQHEVQNTGLSESAVLTDHQPVQGVTVPVGGLLHHLSQSVVAEKGRKTGDVSVVWLVILEVGIACDKQIASSCGVLVQKIWELRHEMVNAALIRRLGGDRYRQMPGGLHPYA